METITATTNEKIKQLKSLCSKKGRNQTGLFLIEGKKVLFEALDSQSGIQLHSVFALQAFMDAYQERFSCPLYCVNEKVLQSASDVRTPNDVLACATIPDPQNQAIAQSGLFVMLDGVQDPANVGAILRCADAMGASGVYVGADCADPYCPKAIRAAMGSTFHLPVIGADLMAQLDIMADFTVIAGHLDGKSDLPASLGSKVILLIGSEGRGIRPELAQHATIRYRLHMKGRAESLNAAVATGIMLYELSGRMV